MKETIRFFRRNPIYMENLAGKISLIYVALVYFFYAGMLVMGWFEYYFYHLPFLEVPVWVFILYLFFRKFGTNASELPEKKESLQIKE